ncbi:MAG TPA: hypothetical protein DCZ56_03335 [Sutterella sp.]|nr:hypothetical protein [Sutterella sp.]
MGIFLQYALSYRVSGIPYALFAKFDFGEKKGDFAKIYWPYMGKKPIVRVLQKNDGSRVQDHEPRTLLSFRFF